METAPEGQPRSRRSIAEIRARVETLADGLGMGLDEGIKEAVVGLIANDIRTSSSCEGHLDHGLAFPWVQVEAPEPPGMESDDSGLLKETWRQANHALAARADALLEEFYADRDSEVRIGRENYDEYGVFRIEPVPFPRDVESSELKAFRSEMDAFANFAIQKAEGRT